MNGAGAAAIAIAKILLSAGVKDIILCDRTGLIYKGREKGMNPIKEEMAEVTNPRMVRGTLKDSMSPSPSWNDPKPWVSVRNPTPMSVMNAAMIEFFPGRTRQKSQYRNGIITRLVDVRNAAFVVCVSVSPNISTVKVHGRGGENICAGGYADLRCRTEGVIMELKQIEFFIAACECGSLSKAAEALYTSQPNVSKVIRGFENELGKELFERTSKGLRLTDYGKTVHEYAVTILKNASLITEEEMNIKDKMFSISTYQSHGL